MNLGNELYHNQFKQGDVRGREDNKLNLNKLPCKIVADSNEIITAGDLVKLVSGGRQTVRKVVSTDNYSSDVKYGFIPLARMKNKYINNDMATISLSGNVIRCISERPINCGEKVYYDARNSASAGIEIFNNLVLTDFTAISSGSINLLIDGNTVALSNLNFSNCADLSAVAGVFNTALSTNGSAVFVNNRLVISSASTGSNSSVDVSSTSGSVYDALNIEEAVKINGEEAGANFGKLLPKISANEVQGVILCGVALEDVAENQLFDVQIL